MRRLIYEQSAVTNANLAAVYDNVIEEYTTLYGEDI